MPTVITVRASDQAGATLSDKLTTAYALCPVSPGSMFIVLDAGIPKHTGEVLPTPPANCTLLDYRVISEAPTNVKAGAVTLDFGHSSGSGEGDTATVTVAATWVTANSIVVCQVGTTGTADHNMEDAVIEGIQVRANNIIPGISFDIQGYAPGGTWGQYNVIYQGLISRPS